MANGDWRHGINLREHHMAKSSTSTAVWSTIDTASLPADISSAYRAYKDAYAVMKAAREAFELALRSAVPQPSGKRLAIAYNFGKLSVAIVDDDTPARKSAPASLSLADLAKR